MTERYDETERRLSAALQAMASEAPAPAGLWARVASRLDELGTARAWWQRRWGLAAMGAAAAVVLAVGGVGTAQLAAGQFSADDSGLESAGWELVRIEGSDNSLTWGPSGPRGPAGSPGPAADRLARVYLTDADQASGAFETETPIPMPALPAQAPQARVAATVVTTERQVISRASLNIETPDVNMAVAQLRRLVDSVEGFLEHVSTSGAPIPQSASATVRVPSDRFLETIDRIERLGKAVGQSLGQEDVTLEVIDIEARLESQKRTESSLLELLDRTASVNEILDVERELGRVRADIEAMEGRLSFLTGSVALATIYVEFLLPPHTAPSGSSASLRIEVDDVEQAAQRIRTLVRDAEGSVGDVTLVVREEGAEAYFSFLAPGRAFEAVLASTTAEGKVLYREVRQPGSEDTANADLLARVDVTLRTPPVPSRWLTVGLPVGGALVLLIVAGAVLTRRRGRV